GVGGIDPIHLKMRPNLVEELDRVEVRMRCCDVSDGPIHIGQGSGSEREAPVLCGFADVIELACKTPNRCYSLGGITRRDGFKYGDLFLHHAHTVTGLRSGL